MANREQVFWEAVAVGSEVPALAKVATTQMLVKWAGASGDFNPLHYDDESPLVHATGGIIVHGALKRQWLVQLLTDWVGEAGWVRRFSCQYRAMDYPRRMKNMTEPEDGETWTCRGTVTGKSVQDGQHLIECDVWVENGKGQKTTVGSATVRLPAREA